MGGRNESMELAPLQDLLRNDQEAFRKFFDKTFSRSGWFQRRFRHGNDDHNDFEDFRFFLLHYADLLQTSHDIPKGQAEQTESTAQEESTLFPQRWLRMNVAHALVIGIRSGTPRAQWWVRKQYEAYKQFRV